MQNVGSFLFILLQLVKNKDTNTVVKLFFQVF